MNEIYEEYKQEHPEELVDINRLKAYSQAVETRLEARRKEKIERIEECRKKLEQLQTEPQKTS